ncbi:MAG: hypothetical protein NTV34_12320 [Proteobacteria bacterium]|nr:hypothetical protein [Pseudomonadota bacterium]
MSNGLKVTGEWLELSLGKVCAIWPDLEVESFREVQIIRGAHSNQNLIEHICNAWSAKLIPLLLPDQFRGDFSSVKLLPSNGAIIGFVTSGSTSLLTSVVWKSWGQLNSEAQVLAQAFGVNEESTIVTLVPAIHIYGFLYGVILPCIARAKLISSGRWDRPFFAPSGLNIESALVISVPPLWSCLEGVLGEFRSAVFVSSGAAFGLWRAEAAAKIRRELCANFQVVDVVGSTETGGIGWRQVVGDYVEDAFNLFNGVSLIPPKIEGGAWQVRSPFTDDLVLEVSDVFNMSGEGAKFSYAGRSDRVVKMGAKRIDLGDIEAAMSCCAEGKLAVCLFVDSPDSPKGGSLHVFIETGAGSDGGDSAALMRLYQNYSTHLPIPAGVHFVSQLPRGPMGKISRLSLERLLAGHHGPLVPYLKGK